MVKNTLPKSLKTFIVISHILLFAQLPTAQSPIPVHRGGDDDYPHGDVHAYGDDVDADEQAPPPLPPVPPTHLQQSHPHPHSRLLARQYPVSYQDVVQNDVNVDDCGDDYGGGEDGDAPPEPPLQPGLRQRRHRLYQLSRLGGGRVSFRVRRRR